MPRRDIGIDHLTALDLRPADLVRAAAGAGFASASLRTIHIEGGEPAWAGEPLEATRLAREAADLGTRIHAIEAVAITPRLADRIDALRPSLQQGAELGAGLVYSFADDPDEARCADAFALLVGVAAEFGMRALLEPMPYRAVATLPRASEIVSRAGGAGGLIVDALHASRGGTGPRELARMPERQLAVLQLCDAPAQAPRSPSPSGLDPLLHEARFERLRPGEGGLPLAALAAVMPHGALITVEAPTASAGGDPRRRLADVLAAARGVLDEAVSVPTVASTASESGAER